MFRIKIIAALLLLFMAFAILPGCKTSKPVNIPPPPPPPPIILDSDSDGIADPDDNCKDIAGIARYQGCPAPDTDGDGVNDEMDRCPNSAGRAEDDGCPMLTTSPMPDRDGDGVLDEEDRCPDAAGNAGTGGCPVMSLPKPLPENNGGSRDSDGDGVPDSRDHCPDVFAASRSGCPYASAIKNHIDSSPAPRTDTGQSKQPVANASIAYSYFTSIKINETKWISVKLRINSSTAIVAAELDSAEEARQVRKSVSSDTNEIKTLMLKGYKYITVRLVYDTADFSITRVNTNELQVLDSVDGNNWDWQVKAITEKQQSNITITFLAEKEIGGTSKKDEKQVTVDILIDHISAWRKILNWVLTNPQYSVPSIIVPLFLFAFRRKKNTGKEEAA